MFKIIIKTFLIILTLQLSLQAREINIDTLVNQATSSNKHLFIFLHKTDCGYCESMVEFTLENEIIQDFTNKNFVYEHINVYDNDNITYKEFKGSGRQFAKSIGYDFYPTTLFFDANAKIVYSEVGYRDNQKNPNEEKFLRILNFIDSKSYNSMDFEGFEFQIEEEL